MNELSLNVPLNQTPPDVLTILNFGEALVTIKPDGTLVFGPNYHPDEAARIFWDAIASHMPPHLKTT